MVQRVITKANGRPKSRKSRWRRHVYAIEKLRGDAHRLAVIFPQMRNQRPDLVQEHYSRCDTQADDEIAKWNDAARNHHQHRYRPDAARRFLPCPIARKVALWSWPHELRIDLQA